MNRFSMLEFISGSQLEKANEVIERKDLEELDADGLYTRCFQLLKIGGLEAEIPRLVVLGQQSMGKTTLLDFLMGGPVGYSSTDTGTRQPVVILLKPSDEQKEENKACRIGSEIVPIQQLQNKMKQFMMKKSIISTEELEVEIPIPGCLEAVFVDLPGIKDDSKDDAEMTRNVVRKYISNNPNDIYLLVKKSSDDPANWSWSLREFLLGVPPHGLGLSPHQTLVIGTRAKEFLMNEKNDIRTQQELLTRVEKRGVRDMHGEMLPLYLLELFSLSIHEREHLTFQQRQSLMHKQLREGKQECHALLNHFHFTDSAIFKRLCDFFDPDLFREDLSSRFQTKLKDQLFILEERLTHKLQQLRQLREEKKLQYINDTTSSVRETIQLYLRVFFEIVTELVTGNYMILRMENYGEDFLTTYGATLQENLKEGNALAWELFANHSYQSNFLQCLTKKAENLFSKENSNHQLFHTTYSTNHQRNKQDECFVSIEPQPDVKNGLQLGQYVRFFIHKNQTQMLGHLHSLVIPSTPMEEPKENSSVNEGLVNVAFYHIGDGTESGYNNGEESQINQQLKQLHSKRLHLIYPLTSILQSHALLPPENFRCWRRYIRQDYWIGLKPVLLKRIQWDTSHTKIPSNTNSNNHSLEETLKSKLNGTAFYVLLSSDEGDLSGDPLEDMSSESCPLDQLYCDQESICFETPYLYKTNIWRSHVSYVLSNVMDDMYVLHQIYVFQHIAGEFAEMKLLNEQSLTHLTRWFRFHISLLEPEKQFSKSVLVQLMRSVKHVVDKADWEPLVADLLQANIRDGLLQLARLAACGAATALRRVFRAAVDELQRRITLGEFNTQLLLLCKSTSFLKSLSTSLDDFCRERAKRCCQTMGDLIFELTHTIHFDMVEEIFQGCQRFEKEFLQTQSLEETTHRVREELHMRKKLLAKANASSPCSLSTSYSMLHDEVKVQFWIMKMLLSAPLTIKLYMYFIKDIKDRSLHLASEGKNVFCVGDLETHLQSCLLYDQSCGTVQSTPLTSEQLTLRYELQLYKAQLEGHLEQLQRVVEYLELTLDVVMKLKAHISKKQNVHFLSALWVT